MDIKSSSVSYFRNFIFGVEDSLVSTVGLLSGIAIANVPRETILITGIVLIFVEAFSMAAGSFLSEYSARGYVRKTETPRKIEFISAGVMLFSYFISGFIPLAPYTFLPAASALPFSIVFSIAALFVLGVVGAKISGINVFRNGLRMTAIGGFAIVVGIAAGSLL